MRTSNERGIALITALLVMMLISALLVGFTTVVITDQRYRFIDKDRSQAFYGATAGVEKLTADLGNTFLKNVAPTNAQVTALTGTTAQPAITNVSFAATAAPTALPASELSTYDCNNSDGVNRTPLTVGANGYTITFCALTATNNPTTLPGSRTINNANSPYDGLYALKTPYQVDVTAKTNSGGEVHLSRTIEAVAVPVFQFGIFSDVDLAFHSGDDFAFGGRVHTNGNLFLAVGDGKTLTLGDKVTAYKDIIRAVLPNGNAIANNNSGGTVNMTKGGGTYRALAATEGSVQGGPGSTPWSGWTALSLSTYKGYIKNGANGATRGTGAKMLTLPIIAPNVGGTNIDVIRRPRPLEDTTSILYGERMFNKASIRVMLSDTAADITNIPGVDNTVAPKSLEAGAGPYGNIPIATPQAAPAWAGQLITTAVAAGNGVSMTIAGGALPGSLQIPATLTVSANAGANQWSVTNCKDKSPTQFINCTIAITVGGLATIPINATVTAAALPGISAVVAATVSTGGGKTLTVTNATTTLNFSPNTFWVDDQRVTCTGYTTSTAPDVLTGCNVNINIPANEKLDVSYRTTPVGTSTLGGVIKIERQNANDGTWHDITAEILGYGIGAPASVGTCAAVDPSPNAILRLQRLADDSARAATVPPTPCPLTANGRTITATDYWPGAIFDAREAWTRPSAPAGTNIKLGGVMYYVAVDAGNLAKWFAGQAPYNVVNPVTGLAPTGNQSKTDNTGYSIYISDRRNNRDTTNSETAEWGWEDFVNPADATGAPNGVLDAGEDVNASATLDTYGGKATCNGKYNVFANNGITCTDTFYPTLGVGAINPLLDLTSTVAGIADTPGVSGAARAMTNRAVMFRRAVKLINGDNLVASVNGLTVVTENPVYIAGNWNSGGGNFANAHAATAVLADAVTLLSSSWIDTTSFLFPFSPQGSSNGLSRLRAANSWYRVAVLAGKGIDFPLPAVVGNAAPDFGSDGGVHNFLRMLEGSPGADTVNYVGSMASIFYNRQAVGVYKTNGVVYGVPTRAFSFDLDLLDPAKLPPLTPMFRDMDSTGFSQNLQPGK